jgi:hypothetical protein
LTAGHTSDDRPINQPPLDEVLRVALSPQIAHELIAAPVIIEDFDCPDLGGSSTRDLVTIFIDRTIAKARPTLKRTKLRYEEWRSAVALHEQFEVILHRLLGLQYDAPGLNPTHHIPDSAHGFATGLEHWYVRHKLKRDPAEYEDDLSGLIDRAEVEHIKKPPLDLACFAYFDEPDARDIAILKRLAQLGVKDAMPEEHPLSRMARELVEKSAVTA